MPLRPHCPFYIPFTREKLSGSHQGKKYGFSEKITGYLYYRKIRLVFYSINSITHSPTNEVHHKIQNIIYGQV